MCIFRSAVSIVRELWSDPVGAAKDEIQLLGSLSRLDLRPGDKFVLTLKKAASLEQIEHIQRTWRQFVGNEVAETVKLLVLDDGAKIGVISAVAIEE